MRRVLAFLLTFHFLLAPAWSEMTVFRFFNNVGGLNDGFGATAIEDNEASELSNIVFTTGGFIARRDGFTRINSTAITGTPIFTGITYYKRSGGTQFLVAVLADDTIRKMNYAAGEPNGTWDNITGTLVFAAGADDQADFSVGEDTLIIEDGITTTAPYSWSGTGNAAALSGSPPNASMVEYHKGHAWLAGESANPSRVYFSNLNDINTWTTATDFFRFDTNDGSIVRGLQRSLDALYVWKDHSIHRITGDERDTFRAERMVDGIGTCSDKSIVRINNRFLFLTCEGDIAIYDGGITVQIISAKIQGTIDSLNATRFDEAVATELDEDYYLSVSASGASQHNRIILFDTFHQAFTVLRGIAANALTKGEFGDGNFELFFGNYGGFASRYPEGNSDAGTAITSSYTTKWFQFPQLAFEKRWRLLRIFANQLGTGRTLNVEQRNDFASSGTSDSISLAGSGSQWGVMRWGVDTWGGGSVVTARIETNLGRNFFQINFSDSTTSSAWTVRGFEFWMEESGRI